MREERRKPWRCGEDTKDALRGREIPEAGVIGGEDPGGTVDVGAQNELLTVARFFLGRGGSARNANLGAASISRMMHDGWYRIVAGIWMNNERSSRIAAKLVIHEVHRVEW